MKKENVVGSIMLAFIFVGIAIVLWTPAIFQKGNPLPYLYAASKINNDNPYIL